MRARVRADCRWGIVTAFGGREYVRYEWRNVPSGNEATASNHSMLDVSEEVVIQQFEVLETVTIEDKLTTDYSGFKLTDLRSLALAAGIGGYQAMRRAELIAALEEKQ